MFKSLISIVDIFSYSPGKKIILSIANILTIIICCLLSKWTQSFSTALIPLKYIILIIIFTTVVVAVVKQCACLISTIVDLFKKENLPVILVNFIFSSLFILLMVFQARQIFVW